MFKPNDRVIFIDQEVTFLSYFDDTWCLIRFDVGAEELVTTNIMGETYVASRLLHKINTCPPKEIE